MSPGSSWITSSRSNESACAQCRRFRKSSYSAYNGACTEIGQHACGVAVRDSKDPEGPVLHFPGKAWRSFLSKVKESE